MDRTTFSKAKVMKKNLFFLFIFCLFVPGCTNKSKTNCNIMVSDGSSKLISSDTLGTEVHMKVLQGNYTIATKEIFAIVLNPQQIPLSYGYSWLLEKWDNNHWIIPKMKKEIFILGEEMIPIQKTIYYCFNFPIEYYEIVPGKYRICKPLWNDTQEIKLYAEFYIQ